jgi:hypothetical protein
MGNKASSPCRKKDAGDACEVKEDDRIKNATYTCQALDDDDEDKLTCAVSACTDGFLLNAAGDACVDNSIVYPTGWKHATVSVSKPGFKAYDGFIDSGGNPIAGYRDYFGANTIEECYKNASPTTKVIGIRTEEHPNGDYKKTCFEYGDGYQTWVDKPFIGKGTHVMTCKDPRKDLKKKECYTRPPEGYSFGRRF